MEEKAESGARVISRAEPKQRLEDSELIAAMRRDEVSAFIEFIDRFRHLAWNEARSLGIDSSVRKSWTEEVLHDCALALTRDARRIPGNIAGYVIVSVRRRLFAERRKETGTIRVLADFAHEAAAAGGSEPMQLPEPVMKLASALAAQITEEEEALLEWKRRKLGYTQAAEWLGVKRDTVAHRTLRLTARLRKAAQTFLETLSDDEILIVRRFIDGIGRGEK